ncbi:hypothetical protein OY671_009383, partial [Metschnikowia pulcherrima]
GAGRARHIRHLRAAQAATAGQGRRRQAVPDRVRIQPRGRPARRHRRSGGHRAGGREDAGPARRHWFGQDLHHGQGDRGTAAPGADPGAQQDPCRAALWRIQELLPRKRGGILRLVLRLLPARSLRAPVGHLYREGKLDQRGDRPDAPFGHARAAGTR